MKSNKIGFVLTFLLFLAFVIYTILIMKVDVQAIGPENSEVGFATFNSNMAEVFGINMIWYNITDILGKLVLMVPVAFGILGLVQLIKSKSLKGVDGDIIALGVFYILVIGAYAFFEVVVINYRPVILDEGLEASYPSSHTMLAVCVMVTAIIQFGKRISNKFLLAVADSIATIILLVVVVGRFVSGVHWFTDICGGLLLSSALVVLYASVFRLISDKENTIEG